MAMSDLPRDLLENIFSRFPYESLRNLRLTCKLWNALFKDPEFIKDRFHKPAREVIVLIDSWVCSLNLDLDGDNNYTMLKLGSLCCNHYINSNRIYISDMFYCDGLLLFRTTTHNNMLMLIVWNPCSEQTRLVYLTNNHKDCCIFSLGYHNDSYKVLSLCIHPKGEPSELVIYELNSNSWRALDEVTLGCIIQSRGVSLKGNTYWIASDKDLLLLCFDFTTERFGRLNLPSKRLGYEISGLSVVRKDDLSVLQQSCDTSKIEIWVMTNDKIDQTKVLSWVKLWEVDLNTSCDRTFTCDVSFFIDEEKKVVVCLDEGSIYIFGEDHDYRNHDFCADEAAMSQGWFKFNLEATQTCTKFLS